MKNTRLYRRRYVPDECVELKNDKIIYQDSEIIVTKWDVLKPRPDINHGYSVYYLNEGYKLSKMYNVGNELVYWYCDIVDTQYDEVENAYTFNDLLIDVLIYPNGHVEVVDLDEFADFTEQGALETALLAGALRKTDKLLKQIYQGQFTKLTEPITSREDPQQ